MTPRIDPLTISVILWVIEAGLWMLVKIVRRWRRRRLIETREVLAIGPMVAAGGFGQTWRAYQ